MESDGSKTDVCWTIAFDRNSHHNTICMNSEMFTWHFCSGKRSRKIWFNCLQHASSNYFRFAFNFLFSGILPISHKRELEGNKPSDTWTHQIWNHTIISHTIIPNIILFQLTIVEKASIYNVILLSRIKYKLKSYQTPRTTLCLFIVHYNLFVFSAISYYTLKQWF